MKVTKLENGWHYEDTEPSKAWYKILITYTEFNTQEVVKLESSNIEETMLEYQVGKESFEWKMLDWNIRV